MLQLVLSLLLTFAPSAHAQTAGRGGLNDPGSLFHKTVIDGTLAKKSDAAPRFTVHLQMINADGSNSGSCTGALIAEDMVLTAGHCFLPTTQKVKVSFGLGGNAGFTHSIESKIFEWVKPTTYLLMASAPSPWVNGELYFDPEIRTKDLIEVESRLGLVNYSGRNLVDPRTLRDFAVIRINAIPKGYQALEFFQGTIGFRTIAISAGYGVNSRKQSELDGRLRWSEQELIGYYEDVADITMAWQAFSAKQPTCFGDSGGPMVIKTDEGYQLMGINLFGYNGCSSTTWFGNPNHYQDLIRDTMKHLRARNDI